MMISEERLEAIYKARWYQRHLLLTITSADYQAAAKTDAYGSNWYISCISAVRSIFDLDIIKEPEKSREILNEMGEAIRIYDHDIEKISDALHVIRRKHRLEW